GSSRYRSAGFGAGAGWTVSRISISVGVTVVSARAAMGNTVRAAQTSNIRGTAYLSPVEGPDHGIRRRRTRDVPQSHRPMPTAYPSAEGGRGPRPAGPRFSR